jgi:hypothetical protein
MKMPMVFTLTESQQLSAREWLVRSFNKKEDYS